MPATNDSGSTPAQTARSSPSSGSSDAPYARTLTLARSSPIRRIDVAASSLRVDGRTSSHRPGIRCSETTSSAASFSSAGTATARPWTTTLR